MSKILVATEKPFSKVAVDEMKQVAEEAGLEIVLLEKYTQKAELLQAVTDTDALIVRSDKVDAEVIAAAKNLKIVVRAGAGYDNLNLEACTRAGVVAMNTPGQNANSVAELVFGLLIMAVRNFYDGSTGSELLGKRLGLLAFGNVGRNVARIAHGFGMEVMAYDAFCPAEHIESAGVKVASSKEELFELCDIVSLHIPATDETRHSIDANLVSKMHKGGILINTARKEIIDETSLLQLMMQRSDLKYVTDIKPDMHEEYAQALVGRYFSTPKKMGAQTAEANANAGIAATRQIVGYLKDGITKFQLNK